MSEEELSSCHDRAYPDHKVEVTITIMLKHEEVNKARNRRMPNGTYGGEREKDENLFRFPTYSIRVLFKSSLMFIRSQNPLTRFATDPKSVEPQFIEG